MARKYKKETEDLLKLKRIINVAIGEIAKLDTIDSTIDGKLSSIEYKTENIEIDLIKYFKFLREVNTVVSSKLNISTMTIPKAEEFYQIIIKKEVDNIDLFFENLAVTVLGEDDLDENLLEIIETYNELRKNLLDLVEKEQKENV